MQLELSKDIVDCQSCIICGRDANRVRAAIADLKGSQTIQDWQIAKMVSNVQKHGDE